MARSGDDRLRSRCWRAEHRRRAGRGRAWDETLAEARGQTVYWNAWGGDEQINAYIAWVGEQVRGAARRSSWSTSSSPTPPRRSRAWWPRRRPGATRGGSVDLIWINGENFAAMKAAGPAVRAVRRAAAELPLRRHRQASPRRCVDFTMPTDGFEAPWGMAQFVFLYDTAVRRRAAALDPGAARLGQGPSRAASPIRRRPTSSARTFLKHVLIELTPDPDVLQRPVGEADFAAVTAPLWHWLEAIGPHLWRQGESFPASGPALASAARRRRGRLLDGVQPGRGVGRDRAPGGCPRACAPSSSRPARSATPTSSRSRSTPRTRKAPWWSPTS